MPNQKQSRNKRLNMTERAKQQMDIHFKEFPKELLWYRQENAGFSTIPRTLPLAMQVIDTLTKGHPAGHTLLCLWMRAPDFPFLTIEAPSIFAAEAAFSGERAIDTWRRRMRALVSLEFIKAAKGPSGDFHYVLLLNPNIAVEKLRQAGKVQNNDLYGRFFARLDEIGAQNEITNYNDYCASLEEEQTESHHKATNKRAGSGKTRDSSKSKTESN